MKWVILCIWAAMTFVLVLKGEVSGKETYIGASMILAAEYVAEEAKKNETPKRSL